MKRTTAVVLTASSGTTPKYAAKRGLLTTRSATRTTTVTVTIVIRATTITSATIRIGNIATGTVYISRKALLALT